MEADEVLREETPVDAAGRFRTSSPRVINWLMGLLVVYVIVRGVVAAEAKPFWIDEICTLAIADQPSLHGMWTALSRGFDSHPPAFFLIERAALGITSNKQVALRLPSILAFAFSLVCVFAYVKKRSHEVMGLLCALLLLSTNLFHYYLTEARPYSMVVACIAFALLCYQRLPSPIWTGLLGMSLILAESVHYYALFAMVPFGLAEAVLLFRTRRFRWPVWAALAAGTLPLLVFWPLLVKIKSYYGNNVFSRPILSKVPEYYGSYFLSDGAFGVALMLVAAAAIVRPLLWPRTADLRETSSRDTDAVEGTLLLGLIALPFIVFVIVRLLHGGMVDRYTIAATLGIILGLTWALSAVRPKVFVFIALFVVSSIGVREFRFWHHSGHNPFAQDFSPTGLEEFLKKDGYGDLPVVVAQEMLYLPLAYYSPQRVSEKLVYLADEKKELQYEGTDTMSKLMLGLRGFFPVQVAGYREFATTHKEFLLYTEGGSEWWLMDLLHEASSVQLLAIESNRHLYLVKMKQNPLR
jgi:dolichyl-phosphate-mannose-protein mannosyltransferase